MLGPPGQEQRPAWEPGAEGSFRGDRASLAARPTPAERHGFHRRLRERRRAWRELQVLVGCDPYPAVEQYLGASLREREPAA